MSGLSLKIYDTKSEEVEEFETIKDDIVRMYICGQTVYDYMHIGHARTYVSFDIIRRYLEYLGYSVKTVINITDVNDKINNRAEKEDRSPWDVAEEFSTINLEDFESLGVKADAFPKASEYIDEMIELIEKLIENEMAYEVDGDVFFDVRKLEDYGKLSNRNLEDMKSTRDDEIKSSEKKENPEDFVLWRSRKGSEFSPTWESPWGEGIPGWHIECSTMAMNLLGEQIDIHAGGSDLVFPHHENEIAQVKGVTGKDWVSYWIHSGLVRIEDEKMSKSKGNFISARELLEEYEPETIRLMIAETHYRDPIKFSERKLEEAEEKAKDLEKLIKNIENEINKKDIIPNKLEKKDLKLLDDLLSLKKKFLEAMNKDFNTPEALKNYYQIEKELNKYLSGETKKPVLKRAKYILLELGSILGITKSDEKVETEKTDSLLENILSLREELREKGEYELADDIRDSIEESGIEIEDTEKGPRWRI